MGSERDDIHRLIDELPDDLAGEVRDFAQFLQRKESRRKLAAVRAALDAAPEDDEPFGDEERAEVASRLAAYQRDGGISLESLVDESAT